jgi:hypothetical protein
MFQQHLINFSSNCQRSTRYEWHVALPQRQESGYTIIQAAAGATKISDIASNVFLRCTKASSCEWNAPKVTSDTRLKLHWFHLRLMRQLGQKISITSFKEIRLSHNAVICVLLIVAQLNAVKQQHLRLSTLAKGCIALCNAAKASVAGKRWLADEIRAHAYCRATGAHVVASQPRLARLHARYYEYVNI